MTKFLKERRTGLGKDLQEIAEVTRIKGTFLRSIEEEEFDKLPVEVYTRGYIKEYAEFLGIPADIALEPYEKYLEERKSRKEKEPSAEKAAATLTREVIDSLEPLKGHENLEDMDLLLPAEETSRSAPRAFPLKLLWVLPVIAIAAGIYFLIPATKSTPPAPQRAANVPATTTAPQQTAPQQPAPQQTVQSPQQPTPSAAAPTAPSVPKQGTETGKAGEKTAQEKKQPQSEKSAAAGVPEKSKTFGGGAKKKHTLDVDATQNVWIKVVIDGVEKKEILLNQGDKVSYGGNTSFVLTVGNAAGARVFFDGKGFEDLGAEGEVVRLTFPLQEPAVSPSSEPRTTESGSSENQTTDNGQ